MFIFYKLEIELVTAESNLWKQLGREYESIWNELVEATEKICEGMEINWEWLESELVSEFLKQMIWNKEGAELGRYLEIIGNELGTDKFLFN